MKLRIFACLMTAFRACVELNVHAGQVTITDCESRNGVRIGDRQISETTELTPGMHANLGGVQIALVDPATIGACRIVGSSGPAIGIEHAILTTVASPLVAALKPT